jgi:hypothetical protein
MMATPWEAAVKNTKQLTVFMAPGLKLAPAWGATMFQKILAEFNRLSALHKLGVTLTDKDASGSPVTVPDPQGRSGVGANVQIEVSSGTHTFAFKTQEGPTHTRHLPGTALDIAGATHPLVQGGEMIRAFVFLPINPSVAGAGSRGVGTGVKLAVAIHEVIHACGLEESDPGHLPNGDPDVFMTGGSLSASFPPDGDPTAKPDPKLGDRIDLGGGKFVPPASPPGQTFLTARTARLIRDLWK